MLAAGAIGSPQTAGALRHRPPAPCSQALGIALRHELPGVGENLQDHLQLRSIFKVAGVQDHERATTSRCSGAALIGGSSMRCAAAGR